MVGMDDTLRVTSCDLIHIVELEKLAKDRKLWNVVKNLKKPHGARPGVQFGRRPG